MSLMVAASFAAIIVTCLNVYKQQIFDMFTNIPEVQTSLNDAWYIYQIHVVFESILAVLSGVVRGTGKQGTASIFQFIGYLFLGIPISCICVFVLEMNLFGLWLGPSAAIVFIVCCLTIMIHCMDWNHEIRTEAELRRLEKERLMA